MITKVEWCIYKPSVKVFEAVIKLLATDNEARYKFMLYGGIPPKTDSDKSIWIAEEGKGKSKRFVAKYREKNVAKQEAL